MGFAVGEQIMHTAHGPGTVVGIQDRELMEGFHGYYEIYFAEKQLSLSIPFDKADDWLRPVMAHSVYGDILALLRRKPSILPKDYRERRAVLESWIRSGAPLQLAQAVRELNWLRTVKPLTEVDRELMERARQRLVAEIVIAADTTPAAVYGEISAALDMGLQEMAAYAAAGNEPAVQ